jgi:hypothetical protein
VGRSNNLSCPYLLSFGMLCSSRFLIQLLPCTHNLQKRNMPILKNLNTSFPHTGANTRSKI